MYLYSVFSVTYFCCNETMDVLGIVNNLPADTADLKHVGRNICRLDLFIFFTIVS